MPGRGSPPPPAPPPGPGNVIPLPPPAPQQPGGPGLRERLRHSTPFLAVVAALAGPVALPALLVPFRGAFPETDAALLLVALVVAIASIGYRPAGILAAATAGIWFDFFLTRPYEQFAITRRADLETTVMVFVVGLAVTELSVRGRRHHEVANEEAELMSRLKAVADLRSRGAPAHQVIRQVTRELIDLLGVDSCRFERGPADLSLPQIGRNGEVLWTTVRWDVSQAGFPNATVELPVQCNGEPFGRFVLHPGYRVPVNHRRRALAVLLADEAGGALAAVRRGTSSADPAGGG
jgi:K+-sensing histidine kinase KdpD